MKVQKCESGTLLCSDYTAQMLAVAALRSPDLAGVTLASPCCTPPAFDSLAMMSNLRKLCLDEMRFAKGDRLMNSQRGLLSGIHQLKVKPHSRQAAYVLPHMGRGTLSTSPSVLYIRLHGVTVTLTSQGLCPMNYVRQRLEHRKYWCNGVKVLF